MSPLLEVHDLHAGYSQAAVLRDISFTVDADEVVAFFGANGAGKTTLLRALSGTLPGFSFEQGRRPASGGDILLAGRSLRRVRPWNRVRAGLAHVPEGRHVFGELSVRENLEAAALVARRRTSVEHVLSIFPRLGDRAKQTAGTLSGGEQQMLTIARAMMTNPKVLAIDEMSAGLAPIIVDQLVEALEALRGTGVALVLVEQSPHFVADIVDRVYLLANGRIVGTGTMSELGGADRLAEMYLGVH